MNTFKLAFNNFKNNLRTYKVYVLAITFTLGMFYNFEALRFNPDIIQYKAFEGSAKAVAYSSLFMLAMFLFFFIWYSSNTFFRQRKKEIAMYCFMGISIEEYGKIFFLESVVLGVCSMISGLLFGILSSRLFFMIFGKVAVGTSQINFVIPSEAIKETIIIFSGFYMIISILEYLKIRRSKLIDLINASKVEDKLKKSDKVKGAIGGVGLLSSYVIIIMDKMGVAAMLAPVIVIIFVIATYWVFQGFIPTAILWLQRNKKIFYKGVNIIAISNLCHRIRKNCRNLTATTILIASAITAFGTCFSLKYSINIFVEELTPHDIIFIQGGEGEENNPAVEKIYRLINENNMAIEKKLTDEILYVEESKLKNGSDKFNEKIVVLKEEYYKDLILEEKSLNRDVKNLIEKGIPSGSGINITANRSNLMDFEEYSFLKADEKIKVDKNILLSLFGKIIDEKIVMINNYDYENLKNDRENNGVSVYTVKGIDLKNKKDLETILKNTEEHIDGEVDSRITVRNPDGLDGMEMIYAFVFAGGIIAIVFVVASGVIVHFNFMNEATIEKDTYQKLINIGVTPNEILKSVIIQSAFQSGISLAIGISHSLLAVSILSKMMRMNLAIPVTKSVLFLSAAYILFNVLSIRSFMGNILSKEQQKNIGRDKHEEESIGINAQTL